MHRKSANAETKQTVMRIAKKARGEEITMSRGEFSASSTRKSAKTADEKGKGAKRTKKIRDRLLRNDEKLIGRAKGENLPAGGRRASLRTLKKSNGKRKREEKLTRLKHNSSTLRAFFENSDAGING